MSDPASASSEAAEHNLHGDGENVAPSAIREDEPSSSSQGDWQELIDEIFDIPITYKLVFEESELEVSSRLFQVKKRRPMKSKEAAIRLTNPDKHNYDTKEHELPKAMIEAFNKEVDSGSKRF